MRKFLTLGSCVLALAIACIQPALASSPIRDMNGKSAEELKELGITIELWGEYSKWKHADGPPSPQPIWVLDTNWHALSVTYDCSKLKEDQEVQLFLRTAVDGLEMNSVSQVIRKKGGDQELRLNFSISKEQAEGSYLQIIIPELMEKSIKESASGDPGFGGYFFKVSRIFELAKEAHEKKIAKGR